MPEYLTGTATTPNSSRIPGAHGGMQQLRPAGSDNLPSVLHKLDALKQEQDILDKALEVLHQRLASVLHPMPTDSAKPTGEGALVTAPLVDMLDSSTRRVRSQRMIVEELLERLAI